MSSTQPIWTYSCVNWLRTLPYVSAWHERYRARGFVVVSVHAPEFGFEHDLDNVIRALSELGVDEELVRVDVGGVAEAADWDTLRSPETYVGYARGGRRSDARADGLALNQWTLTGEWSVRFAVRLDGQPPGDARGVDVDKSGEGTVSEPRMYQLVRQRGAIRQRTFEITFLVPGVRAYVFTFG